MTPRNKLNCWVIVVGVLCVLSTPCRAYNIDGGRSHGTVPKFSTSYTSCQEYQNFSFDEFTKNKRFHLNTLCTTPYQNPDTPAWADIIKEPENFVECNGATIALCYYSGPVTPANAVGDILVPSTPCILRPGEDIADCTCIEIPAGMPYLVDINAILNLDVYLDTVNECGLSGRNCLPAGTKEAPVCKAIRDGKLIPGADLISTFSFALEREIPIVQGECTDENYLYAGCMTAPCKRTDTYDPDSAFPLVQCACPTFTGPFQVGRAITPETPCDLPEGTQGKPVWSAAYTDIDPQAACVPDRPGDDGCPLLPPNYKETVTIPYDVDCRKVCSEYKQSNQNGIQVGFTCDATLCTDPSNRALWAEACMGLGKNSTSEILKLEYEVGYSCAASQICGCEPNRKTNEEIWRLNKVQMEAGIQTQCEYNGTLCGTEPR